MILSGSTKRVFPNIGQLVTATSANDAYLFDTATTTLMRWDGTAWTPMRVDLTLSYRAIAATAHDLVLLASQQQWLGFVRP
jgi:hypothetical protein